MPMNNKSITIRFPQDGITTSISVKNVGENTYQLLEHPVLCISAKYGDIIKCSHTNECEYEFIEVVNPSALEIAMYLLDKDKIESVEINNVLQNVSSNGGYWQKDMGGMLSILFDPNLYDPRVFMDKIKA